MGPKLEEAIKEWGEVMQAFPRFLQEHVGKKGQREYHVRPCFLVYSSTSAVLGLSRDAMYCASNAYMDSLCKQRWYQGLASKSCNWGAIQNLGLAAGPSNPLDRMANATSEDGYYSELKKIYYGVMAGAHDPRAFITEKNSIQALAKQTYVKQERAEARKNIAWTPPTDFEDMTPSMDAAAVAATNSAFTSCMSAENEKKIFKGAGTVEGMKVTVDLENPTADRVLLVGVLPVFSTEAVECGDFNFSKAGDQVGPNFVTRPQTGSTPMMFVDYPAVSPAEYEVKSTFKSSALLSKAQESRRLAAVALPAAQVTSAKSRASLDIQGGSESWANVPGMQQITTTSSGDKVLVVCTLSYSAQFEGATRGVFRLCRDGVSLNKPTWQAVGANDNGISRTIVMSIVDEPDQGLHLYMVQAKLQNGDLSEKMSIENSLRQLCIMRFPQACATISPAVSKTLPLDQDKWFEISGLSAKATVKNASDKVIVSYDASVVAKIAKYNARITVFRNDVNLGHSDNGLVPISSSTPVFSDNASGILVDEPGAGSYTYSIYAKTTASAGLSIADGQMAAIVVTQKK